MQLIKVRSRLKWKLMFEDWKEYEYDIVIRVKGKAIPVRVQDWTDPLRFQEAEILRFQGNRYTKVVRVSGLSTDHFYPPGYVPGSNFFYRLIRTQGHSAAGNRTRDFSSCSPVSQPTPLQPVPTQYQYAMESYDQIIRTRSQREIYAGLYFQ
jgi:hypothetical protein